MGAMKNFLMWMEEMEYIEYIDSPDGSVDWMTTSKHPGNGKAVDEYLTHRDNNDKSTK
jgi:hypothetical protein